MQRLETQAGESKDRSGPGRVNLQAARRPDWDHRRKPDWKHRIKIVSIIQLASLFACFFLLTPISPAKAASASRTVRVGVYQNEPKIFLDDKGASSGIFIDLIREIGAEEGWDLVFVSCTWSECLAALEAGRIDLMPDVAYSADRDQQFDFHHTPVLESWSQVYASPGLQISGFNDLAGKRVAVLKSSIQQTVFNNYMSGFGYAFTFVTAEFARGGFPESGEWRGGRGDCQQFFWRLFLPGVWAGQDGNRFRSGDAVLCDRPGSQSGPARSDRSAA